MTKNPQLLVKAHSIDITKDPVALTVEGFRFTPGDNTRISSGQLTIPGNARITDQNTGAYTLTPTWQKVSNADFYEIDFNNLRYTTIKDTALLFDGLAAETKYSFKIRAVNKTGYSGWKEFSATTKTNPLKFAIQGVTGEARTEGQRGNFGLGRLFDYDETSSWQTRRGVKTVPFDLIIDLNSINQLDKLHYLPLKAGRNVTGNFLKGQVFYSGNKTDWTAAGNFEWANNDEVKVFSFSQHPNARYIRITVTGSAGDAGSAREIYVFKVPGTESYLPGDINNDHLIDRNDWTSYMNYTGLRKGDADFEGYISKGDINQNNLIDAYDISVVATQLDGGAEKNRADSVMGKLEFSTSRQEYNKDEVIEFVVKGTGLRSVNALSFALPYNSRDYEFTGVGAMNMKQMDNLTYDRLHTNGTKSLYVTFVNTGNKETLTGDADLFVVKFKAKHQLKFDLKAIDGMLVDKNLSVTGIK
jgi:hypothetical protein